MERKTILGSTAAVMFAVSQAVVIPDEMVSNPMDPGINRRTLNNLLRTPERLRSQFNDIDQTPSLPVSGEYGA